MTLRISVEKLHAAIPHRKPGYLDAVMAVAERVSDTELQMDAEHFARIRKEYAEPPTPQPEPAAPHTAAPPASGPGTELKAILKDWLGIQASPNCSCNARAKQMDEWGSDLCEQNLPTIVGWLEEQARARKLPFVRFAAEQAVKLAIRRARKKAAR